MRVKTEIRSEDFFLVFYTQSVVSGPKIEVPEVLSKCFPERGTLKFVLFYFYFLTDQKIRGKILMG